MVRIADADIAAIIAYLRTLQLRPDAGEESSFGIMLRGLIVLGEIPIEPDIVDRKDLGAVNRPTTPMALGGYLALSVCATCHGADLHGREEIKSPDLRAVVAAYSLDDFKVLLSTGKAVGGREVGMMSEAARLGLKYLRADEVADLHAYLSKPGGAAATRQ
jgi:cytochrome c553